MGTKYSPVTVSGYNSSPPSDDGSQTAANQVKWSTIKTKLPDPLKTAIEAVNTNLVTALDQSCRLVSSSDSTVAGDHNRTIQVSTSSVTISLMDAATAAAGYIVNIANLSSGDITIGRATNQNTISGSTQNITLPTLASMKLIVNQAANGYNILASNGYTQFGTWTPVLTFATAGDLSVVYSTQSGNYIRIGRLVIATFNITTSTFTHTTASGNLQISGFPFAAISGGVTMFGAGTFQGITLANFTQYTARIGSTGQIATIRASGSGQTQGDVTAASMPTGGTVRLEFTVVYLA